MPLSLKSLFCLCRGRSNLWKTGSNANDSWSQKDQLCRVMQLITALSYWPVLQAGQCSLSDYKWVAFFFSFEPVLIS